MGLHPIAYIPSVGRIELPGDPILPYGGTGFVVGENLLMTDVSLAFNPEAQARRRSE
jgi:hypothetical protein